MRVLYEGEEPTALQTVILSFTPKSPSETKVDLIGAIHIGERSYYEELNRRFRAYDALLYELVAPEDHEIPRPGESSESTVSYLQNGMTQALNLNFQLNCIDYSAKNFVHADMTPREFANSVRERKESFGQVFFRLMGQSIVQQSRGRQQSELGLITALFSENRDLELRRVLAEQFASLDGSMLAFNGPDGSTLITERNKKALSVLRREISRGNRRIGVFFGAGHLSDLVQRLENEFQMQQTAAAWVTAWDLTSTR